MDDAMYESIMPHKKGDIITLTRFPEEEGNEWEITTYLIGGYEVTNVVDGSTLRALTEEVNHAVVDLANIYGHIKHEVVVTYIANPNHDSYLYCRSCKEEVKTHYKRLPKPKELFFTRR